MYCGNSRIAAVISISPAELENIYTGLSASAALADEESSAYIVEEFEDPIFRRELVKLIGGEKRITLPSNAEELTKGRVYKYPIFSSDMEALKK